jgi:outer membrane protein assembly factor BamB
MRRRVGSTRSPLLALVFALLLAAAWPSHAVAAGSAPSGWPQPDYSADGARWNPYETTLSPSNVPSLVVKWRARGFRASTVANRTVYGVADNIQLEARSVRTGALRWRTDVAPPAGFGDVAVGFGEVCTASGWYPGSVYCFDARTGSLVWTTTEVGGQRVFFYQGLLYVWGIDTVTAFVPDTGAVVWSGGQGWHPTTVAADGRVYVLGTGSLDPSGYPEWSFVVARDARTGEILWLREFGQFDLLLALVASNGLLYAVGPDRAVALSPDDGHDVWGHPVDHTSADIVPTMAVTSTAVYVQTDAGQVSALDVATGAGLWTRTAHSSYDYQDPGRMAVANGVLYVSSFEDEYYLIAVDVDTGRILVRRRHQSFTPVVADGQVFTLDDDGTTVLGLPG